MSSCPFLDIPLVGPAQPDPRQAGTWRSPKPRTGPNALGLFVTHPCASRSQETHRLATYVSIAPVVRCPSNWGSPWDGWYEYFPLPGLREGEDFVAKLGEVCPVPSAALEGRRIACLSLGGLEALFHRLAMNALRFPETPVHYKTEAARLTNETNLWERWAERTPTRSPRNSPAPSPPNSRSSTSSPPPNSAPHALDRSCRITPPA